MHAQLEDARARTLHKELLPPDDSASTSGSRAPPARRTSVSLLSLLLGGALGALAFALVPDRDPHPPREGGGQDPGLEARLQAVETALGEHRASLRATQRSLKLIAHEVTEILERTPRAIEALQTEVHALGQRVRRSASPESAPNPVSLLTPEIVEEAIARSSAEALALERPPAARSLGEIIDDASDVSLPPPGTTAATPALDDEESWSFRSIVNEQGTNDEFSDPDNP